MNEQYQLYEESNGDVIVPEDAFLEGSMVTESFENHGRDTEPTPPTQVLKMSEYAHSLVTDYFPPQEGTLFGQEIYQPEGAAEAIKLPVEPSVGAHVELGARAIALQHIMQTFNQLNKLGGLQKSRGFTEFDHRYGDLADEVQENMAAKADRMLRQNEKDYETLTDSAGLLAMGLTDREVAQMRRDLQQELFNAYGTGKAVAADRKKLVKRASKAAGMVSKKKKRTD